MISLLQRRLARCAGIVAVLLPLAAAGGPAASEATPAAGRVKLCGWIENPTPANWSLVDRDGEWVMGEQGGYQAPGLDALPDLTESRWVATNGSYGYGCGCLAATIDRKAKQVTHIYGFKQQSIAACRADHKLPRP